eukprot:TRINITY_DN2383_c0_g1_i4.p1 TRINITY_DN2383_c0_g1~~TRINITY_DN2383_c0_g1_i4.p1  ORF type:complete len:519 (-),score=55.65 TRINITY_DN2383_c0_g1_i4:586-2142(-)
MAATIWPPIPGCCVMVQQWDDSKLENSGKDGQWQRGIVLNYKGKIYQIEYEELVVPEDQHKKLVEEIDITKIKPWCPEMTVCSISYLKVGDAVKWHDKDASGWWSGYICNKLKDRVRVLFLDYEEVAEVQYGEKDQLCRDYDFFIVQRMAKVKPPNKRVVQDYLRLQQRLKAKKGVNSRQQDVNIVSQDESSDRKGQGRKAGRGMALFDSYDNEVFKSMVQKYGPLPLIELKQAFPHLTNEQIMSHWNHKRDGFMELLSQEWQEDYYSRRRKVVDLEAVNRSIKKNGYNRNKLLKEFKDVNYRTLFLAVDKLGKGIQKDSDCEHSLPGTELVNHIPQHTSFQTVVKQCPADHMPQFQRVVRQCPVKFSRQNTISPSSSGEAVDIDIAPLWQRYMLQTQPTYRDQQSLKRKREEGEFLLRCGQQQEQQQQNTTFLPQLQKQYQRSFQIMQDMQIEKEYINQDIEDALHFLKRLKRSHQEYSVLSRMKCFMEPLKSMNVAMQTYFQAKEAEAMLYDSRRQ